mmetsp:Transcript_72956/g.205520  ORF Transcript_72956/g.205520 Transcript_72956/m.205520 type:complete len:297 (+) Transcript_72956:1187-2077(+)
MRTRWPPWTTARPTSQERRSTGGSQRWRCAAEAKAKAPRTRPLGRSCWRSCGARATRACSWWPASSAHAWPAEVPGRSLSCRALGCCRQRRQRGEGSMEGRRWCCSWCERWSGTPHCGWWCFRRSCSSSSRWPPALARRLTAAVAPGRRLGWRPLAALRGARCGRRRNTCGRTCRAPWRMHSWISSRRSGRRTARGHPASRRPAPTCAASRRRPRTAPSAARRDGRPIGHSPVLPSGNTQPRPFVSFCCCGSSAKSCRRTAVAVLGLAPVLAVACPARLGVPRLGHRADAGAGAHG